MSVYLRKCSRQECKGKKCKHKHFHYRFRINGVRYRGAITEAQTKWEADQAEVKIKRDVYDGKYEVQASGKANVREFIEKHYLPWARTNKKSFKNDDSRSKVILKRFVSATQDGGSFTCGSGRSGQIESWEC